MQVIKRKKDRGEKIIGKTILQLFAFNIIL